MAAVAKNGNPSLATINPPDSCRHAPRVVGEDIAAGDVCYIKQSDGKIYRATGAAANEAARVWGIALLPAKVAQSDVLSLYFDVELEYGSGLSINNMLYVSGSTAGGLDTSTSTGGTVPVAYVTTSSRIRVLGPRA